MKKQLVLAAALLTTTAFLQAQTVIGNFEGSSLDGWSAGGGTTISFDTIGATLGVNSLKVVAPGNWNQVLSLDGMSYQSQLAQAQSISLDITTQNSDGSIPSWWVGNQIVLNSNTTGWVGLNGDIGAGVNWGATTFHETYAISSTVAAELALANNISIILTDNTGSSGATIYIDNVVINPAPVPEPGTMALAAAGGAALLFLRRRAGR